MLTKPCINMGAGKGEAGQMAAAPPSDMLPAAASQNAALNEPFNPPAGTAAFDGLDAHGLLTSPICRYFLELARSQSIRQAADRLQVAPSVISRQLTRLEQGIGAQLLERRADGVQLTEAGLLLRDHLGAIHNHIDRALDEIADINALRKGTVQIATVEGITRPFLSGQIADFRSQNPGVAFRLRICGRQRVVEALEQHVSQIGFLYDHFSHPTIEEIGRWHQPLLALAPAGHAFTDQRKLTLADLAGQPCALPDETFGIHHLVKRAFTRAGIVPRFDVVADQLQFLCDYAVRTGAIVYAPLQAAISDVMAGRLVPLNLDCVEFRHRHIYAVTRRNHALPPAAAAFLQEIVQAFAEGEKADARLLARITGS